MFVQLSLARVLSFLYANAINCAWLLMRLVQKITVMNFYKFRMLDKNEQIDLLYKDGIYIGKLKEASSTIVLYQLDSFYVKIFYKKYRYYVTRLYCFTSTALLEPFLDQVNVNDMVKC